MVMAGASSLQQPLTDEVYGVSTGRATYVMKHCFVSATVAAVGLAGFLLLAPQHKQGLASAPGVFKSFPKTVDVTSANDTNALKEKPASVQEVFHMFRNLVNVTDANEFFVRLPSHDQEQTVYDHVIPQAEHLYVDFLQRYGSTAPHWKSGEKLPRRSKIEDAQEFKYRLSVFKTSLRDIIKQNNEAAKRDPHPDRVIFAIRQFADWTRSEFETILSKPQVAVAGNSTDVDYLFKKSQPKTGKSSRSPNPKRAKAVQSKMDKNPSRKSEFSMETSATHQWFIVNSASNRYLGSHNYLWRSKTAHRKSGPAHRRRIKYWPAHRRRVPKYFYADRGGCGRSAKDSCLWRIYRSGSGRDDFWIQNVDTGCYLTTRRETDDTPPYENWELGVYCNKVGRCAGCVRDSTITPWWISDWLEGDGVSGHRIVNYNFQRALYASINNNSQDGVGAGSPVSAVGADGYWRILPEDISLAGQGLLDTEVRITTGPALRSVVLSRTLYAHRFSYGDGRQRAALVPIYAYMRPQLQYGTDREYTRRSTPRDSNWSSMGIAFYAYSEQVAGTVPIYEQYSYKYGAHAYTTSSIPFDDDWFMNLLGNAVQFYAFSEHVGGTVPIYQYRDTRDNDFFYHPRSCLTGGFFGAGFGPWRRDGIAFHAYLEQDNGENGMGAGDDGCSHVSLLSSSVSAWYITQIDTNGFKIINNVSDRALYASVGKDGTEGVGASKPSSAVGAEGIWEITKVGTRWRIVNRLSKRSLYAIDSYGNKKMTINWRAGFGAISPAGPTYDEQKTNCFWNSTFYERIANVSNVEQCKTYCNDQPSCVAFSYSSRGSEKGTCVRAAVEDNPQLQLRELCNGSWDTYIHIWRAQFGAGNRPRISGAKTTWNIMKKRTDPDPLQGVPCRINYAKSSPYHLFRARYQSTCGSCYAFAATDTLRAQTWMNTGIDPGALSAQYVIDCLIWKGCDGGNPEVVFDKVKKAGGMPTTGVYGPYKARVGQCKKGRPKCVTNMGGWTLSGERNMASYICGGSVLTVVAATRKWQHYGGGVMRKSTCGSGREDHALSLVGLEVDDYPGAKSAAWLLRNSWGTGWGTSPESFGPYARKGDEGGYIWLEYGTNACSIKTEAGFAKNARLVPDAQCAAQGG